MSSDPDGYREGPGDGWTVDAFHRGAFHLVQPRNGHHRAGVDALVLAACVPDGFDGVLADLGAGPGAAALSVLDRCKAASADLFERDPVMLEAARRTLALAANDGLAGRARLHQADVTLAGAARRAAGLADAIFDHVIANPPFNDPRDRSSPDESRRSAHVMDEGMLEAWARTACAILKPGGGVAFILRPDTLGEALAAFSTRFGGLGLRFVHPRPGETAIRMLVTGTKGSRARMRVLPPLVLHEAGTGGAFLPDADDLLNGRNGFPRP